MNNKKNLIKGYILTFSGAISWGFSATSGQYLLNIKNLDPKYIVSVRLLVAGLILTLISLLNNKEKTFEIFKNKKDAIRLILFAIFGLLCTQFSYLVTIAKTNAATATILQFLSTVFIVIGVCFKDKRFPFKVEIVSIALALFGTVALATHLNLNTLVISPSGLAWGIFSAFAVVLNTILPLELLQKYKSSTVTGFGMLIGGIVVSIFTRPFQFHVNYDFMTIVGLFGIVIIGTVLAFNLFLKGVSIIGPIKGSLIAGVEAISALIFSIIFLNEIFTPMDVLGMASILIAISILSLSKKK